ncbi:hypothetical protein [Nonomuraea endophytica]|uniref:hypothetical protein n=1 Tax=Nonomuraea endophytica TaxID=714136 RepID=UPI0037C6CBBC
MDNNKTRPRADWSLRPRGPLSSAVLGGTGLLVAAAIGHETGLDPLWAVAGGTVATVGTLVTHLRASSGALAYRLGCCIGVGGWASWALADGVVGEWTLGTLGVGALAAAVLAPLAHRPPRPRPSMTGALHHDRPIGGAVARRYTVLAEEWAARIRRVAQVRVVIEDLVAWPDAGGFSALVVQPLGSSSTSKLTGASKGLAEDARLPQGCSVEWRDGPYLGSMWMDVATVDRLADTIPYPGLQLGRSVTEPDAVRLGRHRDGSTAAIGVRENTTILAGQKRSGKSGTLHNVTADTAALDDCVVWHMDMNGGGISRSWLRPWLQGRTGRPAVDWAASCAEEAWLMAQALVDLALDRKSSTADLKAEANTQLLPVSRELPQILLILDEGKEVLGAKITDHVVQQIRPLLAQLVDIGGNEAVNAVLSVLRSVSTALSTDILKQCANRATMRVGDQSELDYLFGYHRGISPRDARQQGSGFLQQPGGNPRVFKAYFMLPADIERAAAQIAEHRPDLDADAVRAAGPAYATRLERMRWLFATEARRRDLEPPPPVELPNGELWYPAGNEPAEDDADRLPERRRPGTVARRHLQLLPTGGVTAGWGDLDQGPARRPAPVPSSPATERRPGPLRAEQIHAVDAGGQPIPELLERTLQVRWEDGRLHSERLAGLLGMTEHELAALLAPLDVAPLPNAFWRAGQRRRGYERGQFEDAADAIRRGELAVPPEVAAWTAA